MTTTTIKQALSRTNIKPNSEAMKTIGRRAAQSWRATHPGQGVALVREGKFNVIVYPASFKETILKIAKKYCKQRNRPFVVAKRKRTEKNFALKK